MPDNALTPERAALAMRLLQEAVDAAGKGGKAAVARRLGISRPTVSRLLNPDDPYGLQKPIADRIIDRYHVVAECPATLQPQPRSECLRLAEGKAPTHNPLAMRIWKTCQACQYKPQGSNK